MKKVLIVVVCFVLFYSLSSGQDRKIPMFVSMPWLAENQKDPDLVILHVAFSRNEYKAGHIPGAQFLWYNSLAVSTPELSTEMPSVEQADSVLENLGITSRSKIVLYFTGGNITTTTRMLLALAYFGFGDQVGVLDGGFNAWKNDGRPVSTETTVAKRTSLTLHPRASVITDADWVKTNLTNPNVSIIDARGKMFYDGNGGGLMRQGHIKGAVNIPFTIVVDSTNRLKDAGTLQKMFEEAGIKKGTKVVTYCHVGQQATLLFAVARLLGYEAAVYDGCFEDWNFRGDDYPIENPSLKDGKK